MMAPATIVVSIDAGTLVWALHRVAASIEDLRLSPWLPVRRRLAFVYRRSAS